MQLAKTSSRLLMTAAFFALMPLAQGSAQDHAATNTTPFNRDFETIATKFIELAEAMPADKFSWRPMDGVRSVSEVFMLIAAENYIVPTSWGTDAPEGAPSRADAFDGFTKQVTAKEDVLRHLRTSSEHFNHAVASLSAEKLHSEIQFFGRTQTVMDAIYLIAGDMHEHLGQAIAYARMNRVVPPWTARQQSDQSN